MSIFTRRAFSSKIVKFFLDNNEYYGDYNVTTTKSISLIDIANIINKVSKRPVKVTVFNKDLNFQYTGSNNKLVKTIGKIQITSYEDTIKKLYKYYSTLSSIDNDSIIKDKYLKIAKSKN